MTAEATAGRGRHRRPPSGWAQWARPLLVAVVAVASLAVLAVYVFPTRTWLDQRSAVGELESELTELRDERAALEARISELDTDEEIESIARAQYGLVRPGEEAYAILPAPLPPVELAPIWPFGHVLDPDAAFGD